MTDTTEPVAADEPKAPAGHYYAMMKDRRILVKNINTAQSMLLGGMFRQLDTPSSIESYMQLFGKLMKLVESLIADPDDLKWLENSILGGSIDVADFAVIFLPMGEEGTKPKARSPRRGNK